MHCGVIDATIITVPRLWNVSEDYLGLFKALTGVWVWGWVDATQAHQTCSHYLSIFLHCFSIAVFMNLMRDKDGRRNGIRCPLMKILKSQREKRTTFWTWSRNASSLVCMCTQTLSLSVQPVQLFLLASTDASSTMVTVEAAKLQSTRVGPRVYGTHLFSPHGHG